MQILPVNHGTRASDKNSFCGPSAISAVTGMTTGEAARLLRSITGLRSIKGTSTNSVLRALALCNIGSRRVVVKPLSPPIIIRGKTCIRPTLATWLSQSVKLRTTGRVFLVVAGEHFQLVSGRRFVCGRTGEIVSITDKKAHRRARVESIHELVPMGEIKTPLAAKDRSVNKADPSYSKFRKLVAKHGWNYKVYDEGGLKYIQIEPTSVWPKGLDTMHYDWQTTLGRVEHCLENPDQVEEGSYSE